MKIKIIYIVLALLFLAPSMKAFSGDNPIGEIRPIWTSVSPVHAVTITNDNKCVITAFGKNLLFWDLSAVKIVKRVTGHAKDISQLALSLNNKYVLSGDEAGVLKIWDVITGEEIRTINAHDTPIITINLTDDGQYLMTCGFDGVKKLWDFSTGKELRRFKGKEYTISLLSRDGKQVIGEDDNGFIAVWDAVTGEILKKLKMPDKKYSISLFSGDGRYVIIERVKDTHSYPELWDIKEGKKIRIFNFKKYEKNYQSFISHLGGAFTPDNKKILSMFIDFRGFVLWDTNEDQPVLVFFDKVYETSRSSVFSKDGKYIVSSGEDNMARLWDTTTGREVVKLIGMEDSRWLVITPEGYYDASDKTADEQMIVKYKNYTKCQLSNYRDTFYRPDLVKNALSGESLKVYMNITDIPIPAECKNKK